MRIGILSRGPRLYSTRRLVEVAKARKHDVKVLNTLSFAIDVEQGKPSLTYQGKRLRRYDAIVPRIGASITFFGTALVRQFEQMGVFCLNASQAISVSRDKLRSVQILSRHRIGIPRTSFVRKRDQILPAIDRMGGPPVVIKLLEGTQGIGVILADSHKVAEAIMETLQEVAKQNVLLQQFVKESRGRDIRAFVVGGRVVAAMRRVAQEGEFRSNVHRGGRVAAAIVEHIEEEVLFPEIDLRQRLTLQSGYGIMEVPVDRGSPLANVTVRDTGLRERDVLVLSVTRGSVTIPNPKGSREILPGDLLLCFGKSLTLKGLAPTKRQRAGRDAPA